MPHKLNPALDVAHEMLDNAESALNGEQLYDDVAHDAPGADALAALSRVTDAIHTLKATAVELEEEARRQDATFVNIASVTGTTTQSAQERYHRRHTHD